MRLLEHFRKNNTKRKFEVYYPHPPEQDSRQSLVDEEGRYDLTRFSPHEEQVVFEVLRTVERDYPRRHRAMGLANESYCVVYKPRYVLFHIVILRHSASLNPLDQLAVAMAFHSKGYYFYKQAIDWFEVAIPHLYSEDMEQFSSYGPLQVYSIASDLYESDGQYGQAYKYAELASKYSTPDNPYYISRLQKLSQMINISAETRHRAISKRRQQFENDTDAAARLFLQRYEHGCDL